MCHLNTVYHYASFHFQLFERLATIPIAKNNIRIPLLALHLPKSHTKAIMRLLQIVSYAVRKKGMEYKGEQR